MRKIEPVNPVALLNERIPKIIYKHEIIQSNPSAVIVVRAKIRGKLFKAQGNFLHCNFPVLTIEIFNKSGQCL